jgi:DNA repair/transcription protein MET18/MMS19
LDTLGDLLNDFVLSRVSNGAEGVAHCARSLLALEKLGRFDDARVDTVMET